MVKGLSPFTVKIRRQSVDSTKQRQMNLICLLLYVSLKNKRPWFVNSGLSRNYEFSHYLRLYIPMPLSCQAQKVFSKCRSTTHTISLRRLELDTGTYLMVAK